MAEKTTKKKASDPDGKVCGNCLAPGGSANAPKLSACSRCGLVVYCSRDCQRAHWKTNHKQYCIAKADRAPQQQHSSGVDKSSTTAPGNVGDKCTICLDQLTDASATTLPCAHVFHGTCVAELRKLGVTQVCPLCRVPLPLGTDKVFEDASFRYMVVYHLVQQGRASWSRLPAWAKHELDAAITGWKTAADSGNVLAQHSLGVMFGNGRGVAQSRVKAAHWFKRAADQGNANAQYSLGLAYQRGYGVTQSNLEAVRWYRKGAELGDIQAQGNLGAMYKFGFGVKQSAKDAAHWFKKAADQGDVQAQYNLATVYEDGYGGSQSDVEAARWFKKAAEQGDAECQYKIGAYYQEGRGVTQSDKETIHWFKKAADQGFAEAQFGVGVAYKCGFEVPQSTLEAVRWLKKAANQGHARAKHQLDILSYFSSSLASRLIFDIPPLVFKHKKKSKTPFQLAVRN